MRYLLGSSRSKPIMVFALLLSLGASGPAVYAQKAKAATPLPVPERSVSFLLRATPGYSFPLYRNGFLLKRKIGPAEMDEGNLILANIHTGREVSLSHTVEGYKRTVLTAASVTDANTLLTAGYATNGSLSTYFIARSDLESSGLRMLPTHGYLATAVCNASNDTVWAIGSTPHAKTQEPSFALRHYNWGGQILEGAIKIAGGDQHFGLASVDPRQIFLECVKDNVFVYDGISHRLYRYNSTTHTERSWKLKGPIDLVHGAATGFAIADSQKIFVSMREAGHEKQAKRGLYQLLRVDNETSELRPVAGTGSASTKAPFWLLMGDENGRLVYVETMQAGHPQRLNWAMPAKGSNEAQLQ